MGKPNLVDMNHLKIVEVDVSCENKPAKSIKEAFLLGPYSLEWLSSAACLPGKALHLALVAAYLGRLESTTTVKLQPSKLRLFGVDRYSSYRAIEALLNAQLIDIVNRTHGKSATISIEKAIPLGASWNVRGGQS